jgi:hypothetical protein
MKVDVQRFLRLTENAGTIACFDIEATGLRGDYNSILCVSIKPFGEKPYTLAVTKAGEDKKLVKLIREDMKRYDCFVGYYSKGFDWKMLNTRLLQHGLEPLVPKPHIDMYYVLKYHLNTSRRSQGHLLNWLQIETTPDEAGAVGDVAEKMSVSAEVWNKILANPKKEMPKMIRRCESDAAGLEALYRRTNHLIRDIK